MENTNKIQIVSCSGASNTGKYADEVARRLAADGDASMVCLAKVAIGDQPLINKIKNNNSKIIVLDGCPFNCAEVILGREGITDIIHLNTTDFGIIKGKTPFSNEKAEEIIQYIKTLA
ncbi:MAG: putative zinc-binding protein [Bacteroidales bacterium]|nr:putative zinc-binding protein [Bacteroidales bacterium]